MAFDDEFRGPLPRLQDVREPWKVQCLRGVTAKDLRGVVVERHPQSGELSLLVRHRAAELDLDLRDLGLRLLPFGRPGCGTRLNKAIDLFWFRTLFSHLFLLLEHFLQRPFLILHQRTLRGQRRLDLGKVCLKAGQTLVRLFCRSLDHGQLVAQALLFDALVHELQHPTQERAARLGSVRDRIQVKRRFRVVFRFAQRYPARALRRPPRTSGWRMERAVGPSRNLSRGSRCPP
mmetsp:Transcript_19645/g.53860  ORF Transcript_19645/g.53860 Transcript_19645/m.53860 type:complete len:233 (-) Transcript_19645:121-819(-)